MPGNWCHSKLLAPNLARDHLTANADEIFGAHQFGTCFFIYVAPRWQSFNIGNWRILEHRLKVHIYYESESSWRSLYRYTWYYETRTRRASSSSCTSMNPSRKKSDCPIVTEKELPDEYTPCNDISSQPTENFLAGNRRYIKTKGVMIACKIEDFLLMFRSKMYDDSCFIE